VKPLLFDGSGENLAVFEVYDCYTVL